MTRILSLLLSIVLTSFNTAVCLAETIAPTTIEEGTTVRLKLGEAISTKLSAAGQKLDLAVLEDVLDKDGKTVVIKEGTKAIGYLTNLDEKDGSKGGKLIIDITSVTAVDGTKIPLRGSQAKSGHGGAGVGSYVVGGLLLGVVGLGVVALCGHSGNAKMPAGTILNAYVERDSAIAIAPETKIELVNKSVSGIPLTSDAKSTDKPVKQNTDSTDIVPSKDSPPATPEAQKSADAKTL